MDKQERVLFPYVKIGIIVMDRKKIIKQGQFIRQRGYKIILKYG